MSYTFDLRIFLKLAMSAVLTISQAAYAGNSESIDFSKESFNPSEFVNYPSVPVEHLKVIYKAPLNSTIIFASEGNLYKAELISFNDMNSGKPCSRTAPNCFAIIGDSIFLGKAERGQEKNYFKIVEPTNGKASGSDGNRSGQVNQGGTGQGKLGDGSTNGTSGSGSKGSGLGNSAGKSGSGTNSGSALGQAFQDSSFKEAGEAGGSAAAATALQEYGIAEIGKAAAEERRAAQQAYNLEAARGQALRNISQGQVVQIAQSIQNISGWSNQIQINGPSSNLRSDFSQQLEKFDSRFQQQAQSTYDRLANGNTSGSELKVTSQALGFSALSAAVESRSEGLFEVSETQLEMAKKFADVLYGLDPYTGLHRDAFEFMTGKNIVTGEELTQLEVAISGAGLALSAVSFGFASSASNGLKAALRASKFFEPNRFRFLVRAAEDSSKMIRKTATWVAGSTERLQSAFKWFRKDLKGRAFINEAELERSFEKGVAQGRLIVGARLSKELKGTPGAEQTVKWLLNDFKVGSLKATAIYPGSNDTIKIIGRTMGNTNKLGVVHYAEALRREGFKVEYFEPSAEAWADLVQRQKELGKEILTLEELKGSAILKENTKFVVEAGSSHARATIIDLGNPYGYGSSEFYDRLEKSLLSTRTKIESLR